MPLTYVYTAIVIPPSVSTKVDEVAAVGVNDAGQIVGWYDSTVPIDGHHGFLDTAGNFTVIDFGITNNSNSGTEAYGINNAGEIVGTVGNNQPFANGGIFQQYMEPFLPFFPNVFVPDLTQARGVNNVGEIVGDYSDQHGILHGFEYNGSYTTIDYPGGAYNTAALGINDAGNVVGYYYAVNGGPAVGFLDINGSFMTIVPPGAQSSVATGINDAGQIVGYYSDIGGKTHGFLDNNGVFTSLDYPGGFDTFVNGINNNGEIVGDYLDAGNIRAFSAVLSTSPPPPPPQLFTDGDDTVDFSAIAQGTAPQTQIAAVNAGADLYHSLGGNDVVTLPNVSNYQLTPSVSWNSSQAFVAGDGNDTITGGDGADTINLGSGTDTVYGSPGNDVITGGTGQNTFNYQSGPFANFQHFSAQTAQTITGEHSSFIPITTPTQQNVLLLPGSATDYTISVTFQTGVQFFPDALSSTVTTFTTTGADGLPTGISIATTDVEKVDFANPIPITPDNQVRLTGGNVALEMLQLASESYGSDTEHHGVEPLAYNNTNTNGVASDTFLNATAAAQSRAWNAVSAIQLGMAPADFHQTSLTYSFVNGVYQAIDPNGLHTIAGDPAEADAIVLIGNVNGQRTLAISFTGSDQIADFSEYVNFSTYYQLFSPLVTALKSYISDPNNGIQQVLVSGHSLGAPMVPYLLNDLPVTLFPNVHGYTDGSPGAEVDLNDSRVENFIHAGLGNSDAPVLSSSSLASALSSIASGHGDPVPMLGEATGSTTAVLDEIGALYSQYSASGGLPDGFFAQTLNLIKSEGLPQTKERTGGNILIDDDVTNVPTDAAFFGDQHSFFRYVTDLQKVISFANDLNSPFDPVSPISLHVQAAQDLISNVPFTGNIQIAVGQQGSNTIDVYQGDDWVLGNAQPLVTGDEIVWDSPSGFGNLSEVIHTVDGGLGNNNTVLLQGKMSDYDWVLRGDRTDLYYVGANAGGFDGLIGHLYRVSGFTFTANPNVVVPIIQPNMQYVLGTPGQPLNGGNGNGPQTLDGSNLQNETITARNGPSTLIGGSNDVLSGGNGNDTAVGGPNDAITMGNGNDSVFGGSNNTITLGNGSDLVVSGDPSTITLGNGNDTVDGKEGDKITAKNGNDTIYAGDGSSVTVGNGNDQITAGNNCTIVLGKGTDTVVLGVGQNISTITETIEGLSARDTLDLTDINFATVQEPIFAGNKSGGTLTVTDGTNTVNIALIGNYVGSTWTLSNDGSGGTDVVDPPAAVLSAPSTLLWQPDNSQTGNSLAGPLTGGGALAPAPPSSAIASVGLGSDPSAVVWQSNNLVGAAEANSQGSTLPVLHLSVGA